MACSCPNICSEHNCWAECYICGFSYPLDAFQEHYKTGRLVCCECADCMSWSDFKEELEIPPEENCDNKGQPVTGQGGTEGLPSIVDMAPQYPVQVIVDPCDVPWDYEGKGIYYDYGWLDISNISWMISGGLQTRNIIAVSGGGLYLGPDLALSNFTNSITIKNFSVYVQDAGNASFPSKFTIELIKNGSPTGLISPMLEVEGAIGISSGSPVTFAPGDSFAWYATFYELDDTPIPLAQNGQMLPADEYDKRIKIAFEYESLDGKHPNFNSCYFLGGGLASTVPPRYWFPGFTHFVQTAVLGGDPVGNLSGVGFNTPWQISDAQILCRYGRNFIQSEEQWEFVDNTTISDQINFVGAAGASDPVPPRFGLQAVQGPTAWTLDETIPAITLANIDTNGRIHYNQHIGDVISIVSNPPSYEYEWTWTYAFPEHPRSVALVTGHLTYTSNVTSTRRAPLFGITQPGGIVNTSAVSRVSTYIYIKGKFHHFAFYSLYTNVIGDIRARLIVDGSTLLELMIPAGGRLVTEAEQFVCVDGEIAYWEFQKLNGASEPMNVVLTCLYGPEGT